MKIACLGWGSLIWKPESLLIYRHWYEDGPFLPIDYLRQSNGGRLTLVIDQEHGTTVRTLWAHMATKDLNAARESLKTREDVSTANFATHISSIGVNDETDDPIKMIIKEWEKALKIDAVIWTSLPPKFNNENNVSPTEEQAITYLGSLDINKWQTAEEYIRRTPQQIDTNFRRSFERVFGWTFIS